MSFSFLPLAILLGIIAYSYTVISVASWVEERTGSARWMAASLIPTVVIPLGIILGLQP